MATHSIILSWELHGQRSLVGYGPGSCKELYTTQQLNNNKECVTCDNRQDQRLWIHIVCPYASKSHSLCQVLSTGWVLPLSSTAPTSVTYKSLHEIPSPQTHCLLLQLDLITDSQRPHSQFVSTKLNHTIENCKIMEIMPPHKYNF